MTTRRVCLSAQKGLAWERRWIGDNGGAGAGCGIQWMVWVPVRHKPPEGMTAERTTRIHPHVPVCHTHAYNFWEKGSIETANGHPRFWPPQRSRHLPSLSGPNPRHKATPSPAPTQPFLSILKRHPIRLANGNWPENPQAVQACGHRRATHGMAASPFSRCIRLRGPTRLLPRPKCIWEPTSSHPRDARRPWYRSAESSMFMGREMPTVG